MKKLDAIFGIAAIAVCVCGVSYVSYMLITGKSTLITGLGRAIVISVFLLPWGIKTLINSRRSDNGNADI